MAGTLKLPPAVRDRIVDHAHEGAPEEVCGVLGGRRTDGEGDADGDPDADADANGGDGDPTVAVERAAPVPNVADAPRTTYELDPAAQLDAMRGIEDEGLAVVGFYHSHPEGPRRPSATDEARATWPDRSYVIVALDGPQPFVGSWRWTGERFVEERVRVENEASDRN